MNDPLGLFDEEAPDPLGLFAESRPIAGAAETALSIGTGALAQIPAGLAGIGTAITEGSLEKGGAKASQVMEDFTYQPKTATGQKYTENTMNVLNKPVEWLGDAGEAVAGNEGRLVGEILGNFAPDIALGGAGLAARARVKAKPKTSNPKLTALDEIAAAKVAAAETPPTMYGTPDGQVAVGPIPKIESEPSVVALAKQRAAQLEREAKGLSDTMYVGRDGDISGQLGTKIETDPSAVENIRIQQQQGLEDVAKQAELPAPEQLDMFQRAEGEQMRIDNTFGQDPLGLFEELDNSGPKALPATQLSDAQIRQLENKFEALIDDKVVGSLEANLTPEQSRRLGEDSSVSMVKVDPEHRGKGVGSDLYDAWNKAYGGKITPSGKTTAEAWRVWKRNYPEKVEGFVKQEAQRLRDGAPRSVVLENITDPDIRKQVLEASQIAVPKGQRGGLNLSEIIGGFTSPNSKASSVKIEPTVGESLQSRIPGLKEATKDYIPPDDPVASVLEAAKGESDSNIKNTWVKSGATLTAEAAKSSLIKGVGRYFQNATKRAERDIRTYVEPTEKMFRDLSRKDVTELSEVFKREMFADSKFSIDELTQAGFSPEQIDAYGALRVMFDETLKKQNASRTALGMKPITGKEAYLSSRWQGDYRIPVYDQSGKLVWAIAERSERGAKKALEFIQKDLGIKIDKEKSKLRYRKSNSKGELDDAYVTMLEMLDKDDPRIPAIKSAMEEAMSNDAFSTLGQAKHFERKANVRGFVGDRPWMQEAKDAYDMFQQQFQYAKNGFQWSELQKASASAKEVLNDPELQTSQPNNLNYVREYAKQNLGYGELPYVADMERAAAQLIGRDRSAFYNTIGNMKNFFLTTKLAMSLGYVTASLLQPVMVGPWHARLSNQGFKHDAFKSFVGGMGDGSALFARHSGLPDSITPITKIGAEALKYAEENGIVSRNLYDEAAGLGENRGIELLKNTAGVTISAPEKLSRSISFMSFVHHLDQSGVFKDRIKLFQKAEEMTNAAMVDYRRGERPMVFEKLGATGSALGTLQTFKFNYFNQLHTFAKFAKEGNPAPLMMFLGLQGMLGGAVSIPFLEDLDQMFQLVKGWLPADAYKKVAHFTPKKAIIENLPDAVAYGGISKLTGANMSSRFDASNLADFSLDQTFPFITDLARQAGSVASFAANPNDTTGAQAAFDVTPPGLQGLVETNLDSFKGAKTSKGQVYYNPKKIKDADAKFVRTPEQELYRKFGLRELGESRESELSWRQAMNEKELAARLKSANISFYDAVRRKDKVDIVKYAKHYIDFGGDPNKLDSIIKQEVEKGNILPKDYLIIKAKALGSVQKAVRANEQLRTE